MIIFNETHRKVIEGFKQLYYKNENKFIELQDKIVKKGTEQTPLNYWLQMNKVDMKLDLPDAFPDGLSVPKTMYASPC